MLVRVSRRHKLPSIQPSAAHRDGDLSFTQVSGHHLCALSWAERLEAAGAQPQPGLSALFLGVLHLFFEVDRSRSEV